MNSENEPGKLNRRRFLQVSVIGVAAALAIPKIAGAQVAEVESASTAAVDSFRIQSGESRLTPWTHHFHFLDIPGESLDNPPVEGIQLRTTTTLLHQHNVRLTQENLRSIAAGEVVTVEDTVHDHYYAISLPQA